MKKRDKLSQPDRQELLELVYEARRENLALEKRYKKLKQQVRRPCKLTI